MAGDLENQQNLYKISESGHEELSIVQSEDLYNSENDKNDAIYEYNDIIHEKNQQAK